MNSYDANNYANNNTNFNAKYNEKIKDQYGKRNVETDQTLLSDNMLPHAYTIKNRVDYTNLETYSIDPCGCEDADDAFSIFEEGGKLFLAIHIADPTEYINRDSFAWKDIEKQIVTRYPSNSKPIHMMHKEIMDKASLMVNEYGDIKLAITILSEINKDTFHPMDSVKILFTKIKVKKCNALSYHEASVSIQTNDTIRIGSQISEALKKIRGGKTKGTALNELNNSFLQYTNDVPNLCHNTSDEKKMKQMIAEFAIFANSFVGEYLKINFEGVGIYRTCMAKEWLSTIYSEITGQELLNEIIVNGIRAEYLATVSSHDLVGAPAYCHFTSPIRRLTDCVCHYLLKYIHLENVPVPFTNTQLEKYSGECVTKSKLIRKIQYKDLKFRTIQAMNQMLLYKDFLLINYFISSYKDGFLNIIIDNISGHSVYISYTLRRPRLITEYVYKKIKYFVITKVTCPDLHDEGSIPELDALFVY